LIMRIFIFSLFGAMVSLWGSQTLYSQTESLRSGPMVGHVSMREAQLWVQTTEAVEVHYCFHPIDSPETEICTEPTLAKADQAFAVTQSLALLEPDTRYRYTLYLADEAVKLPYPTEFQTPPLWYRRTEPPSFKVAMGSCFYVNDSAYDYVGKPYGGEYEIVQTIHRQRPDLMVWLGDNWYYRESDWTSRPGMYYRASHARAVPELQPLLASTAHYAIWDDHDFGPNDCNGSFVGKRDALKVFHDFWPSPPPALGPDNGIATSFAYGDVEFFLLDNRWFRTSPKRPASELAQLGKAQLDWLLDALSSSFASFKIICIGGMVVPEVDKYETMFNEFPQERMRLLESIRERKIRGVLFMDGDRHHTELSIWNPHGFYPVYDLTVSPLTASAHDVSGTEENRLRVEGTLIGERNFAMLEFSGPKNARQLTIKILGKTGTILWKRDIWAKDLQPVD
jgi:alkaline phosphatase D